MQIGVHQYVRAGPPADSAAGLADLQSCFQQPARERPAQPLPALRELVAPLLGAGSYVVEGRPLRPAVRRKAQLADQAAPNGSGGVQRHVLQRAAAVEPFEQQGTRLGVRLMDLDGAPAAPQLKGLAFSQCFLVRKSELQDRRRGIGRLPADRDHDGAVAVPRQAAGGQIGTSCHCSRQRPSTRGRAASQARPSLLPP